MWTGVLGQVFLGMVLTKAFLVSLLSFLHYFKERRLLREYGGAMPIAKVSVLVPGFNEEATLGNCIASLVEQDYPNYEILIIDDGSRDETARVGMDIARKYPEKVRFFNKPNGGKADALNWGIGKAGGEIVVCIDADSVFEKDTVSKLAVMFNDPRVAAVGGNVKVSNREKVLNRFQAAEYISGLNLERRAFALLNSVQVISGAIGAFRKKAFRLTGGYSRDTLVEDMDLTICLAKRGLRVEYIGQARSYTEAPETLGNFYKQRYRWMRGTWQVMKKYRRMLFNPKYGMMGMVGLPYFLVFPLFDVTVTAVFGIMLIKTLFTGQVVELAGNYLFMLAVQAGLAVQALWMDKEDLKLAFLAGIDSLTYKPIMSFITVKSAIDHMLRVKSGWNKLPRLGKNLLMPGR